jgi:hypothetical protein
MRGSGFDWENPEEKLIQNKKIMSDKYFTWKFLLRNILK